MMVLSKHFLEQALPTAICKVFGELSLNEFLEQKKTLKFGVDSRTVEKDFVFVALEGQKVDGHDFLHQALENGACVLVVKKDKQAILEKISQKLLLNKLVIFVDDTLQALIQLARNWRQKFDYPVVGITGSIGKSSTKKMLESILHAAKFSAYVSYKNQNTIIGLSINILNMSSEHKAAVFELGINDVGEMEQLVDVLRPTLGLITYIAHAHTQGLGKIANVAAEKRKIFTYFAPNNIGAVCGDLPLLAGAYYTHPVIRFGTKTKNQIQARMIKMLPDNSISFILKIYDKKIRVNLNGNNPGFVNNALAATTLAHLLNISLSDIVKGLESFKGFDNRFERKKITKGSGEFISDCYNASPESMKAAILAFEQIKTLNNKIAVLGEMKELGESERFWHRQIGRVLGRALSLSHLILVGKNARLMAKSAPITIKIDFVEDWIQAKEVLANILRQNKEKESLVLVKASHSVGLEKIVDDLSS
jgi:UDP-N-acetylmuramoyl-tripeptide--D-alanyl-D-alanine ligase